jgi:hypothetical protein
VVDAVWRSARRLHVLVPDVAECHVVIEALPNDRKRHPWYNVIVHTTASTLNEPRAGRDAACDDNLFIALREAFGSAYENLVTQPQQPSSADSPGARLQ